METFEDKMDSNKTLTAADNNTQAGFLPSIQNNNLVDIRRSGGNQFSSEQEPNRQPLSINRVGGDLSQRKKKLKKKRKAAIEFNDP
jgi:hypothetical protein